MGVGELRILDRIEKASIRKFREAVVTDEFFTVF